MRIFTTSRINLTGAFGTAVIAVLVAFAHPFTGPVPPSVALQTTVANGDFEAPANANGQITGWKKYLWSGHGDVTLVKDALRSGSQSAMLAASGNPKLGLFQEISFEACSYKMSALIATFEARGSSEGNHIGELHIAFSTRAGYSARRLQSDGAWKRLEATFTLAKAEKTHFYFFMYGDGRFFVDDVKLEKLPGCPQVADATLISETPVAPLVFDPPADANDFVLAGYCDRPDFKTREVCRKIARLERPSETTKPAAGPLVLADFEQVNIFTGADIRSGADAITGEKSGVVKKGAYATALTGPRVNGDWRGYGAMEFDVHNPSSTNQKLLIEIWDDKTNGYWSRVNWYEIVPPGRMTLKVPLSNFVGEKVAVRERRKLNLAAIKRVVLNAYDASSDVLFDNVRLVPERHFTTDFPELLKFDFGPETGQVQPGFIGIDGATSYRPQRGYGIAAGSRIARSEDRRHPDRLLRDWISFTSGGVDIDLPNGRYKIWLVIEDPGYWNYYPSWTSRRIMLKDKVLLEEAQNGEQFFKKYFRHADDEDLPGDNIWARYITPRYKPYEFDVTVEEGQLNLRFASGGDPFAIALSTLLVYPAAKEAQGRAFVKELWSFLEADYNDEYRQHIETPTTPADQRAAPNALGDRLAVYTRSSGEDIRPNHWPHRDERRDSFTVALARGEIKGLSIGLAAVSPVDLARAELDLAGFTVTPWRIRSKATRMTGDGSVYENAPRVLDPLEITIANPLRILAGQSRWLWFDIEATVRVPPGVHRGTLTLTTVDGARQAFPVEATVHPWLLPKADIRIGYLGSGTHYPGAAFPELKARRARELRDGAALLARFGMTAAGGGLGGPRLIEYFTGEPRIDFASADQTMMVLRQHFDGPVNGYDGFNIEGISLYEPRDTTAQFKRPYDTVLADVLAAIDKHARQNRWLPLEHVVGDEPGGDAIDNSLKVAKAFRAASKNARTSIFTSFTKPDEPAAKFAGAIDVIYLGHHSEAAFRHIAQSGSTCALYNQSGRYRRGYYLFKARAAGCSGHMQFAFNMVSVDPWYGLDAREDEFVAVFTHPDGRLRPATDFLRYRIGVDDYRYLLAVDQAVRDAGDTPEKRAAAGWLERTLAAMPIGHDAKVPWSDRQMDELRLEAAHHMNTLANQRRTR
jgi:hypothetical protein